MHHPKTADRRRSRRAPSPHTAPALRARPPAGRQIRYGQWPRFPLLVGIILAFALGCGDTTRRGAGNGDFDPIVACDAYVGAMQRCLSFTGVAERVVEQRVSVSRERLHSAVATADTEPKREALRAQCESGTTTLLASCR